MATKKYEKICDRCGVEAELLDDRIERGWAAVDAARQARVRDRSHRPTPVRSMPGMPRCAARVVSRAGTGETRATPGRLPRVRLPDIQPGADAAADRRDTLR